MRAAKPGRWATTALRPRRPCHRCRPNRARTAYRGDPDRQSRRYHLARARHSRRRRSDRLRGYARDPQAPRPLRHRHAAHALPRPQRGDGAAEAAATARRRRRHRAGVRCRHAAGVRSGLQARARRAGSGPYGHCLARRLGAACRATPSPACRPINFSSPASCRPNRPRGAPASPNSPASRRRLVLFETGPRIAATLADLAAGLGDREAALCRELTKIHEEVRRGELAALAQGCAASRSARRNRAGHRAAGRAGAPERRRRRRAVAAGAGAGFAQGCRRRSRGRDRFAAPRALSARARAGERRRART